MVISGGDFKPDTLKPKEMVSLLLDDDEMETRCEHVGLRILFLTSSLGTFLYLHVKAF